VSQPIWPGIFWQVTIPRARSRYTIEAGDQAATRFAHAEAAQQYTLALELLDERDDPALAAGVRLRLGGELANLSRREGAQAAYGAALVAFILLDAEFSPELTASVPDLKLIP